jgi:hypothetical protein
MKTKNVYVWGNAFYDAYSGVEIHCFFDHEIIFEVPEEMDIEEPSDELHKQVVANATARLRDVLGSKIVLKEDHWELDYVVHNVGE